MQLASNAYTAYSHRMTPFFKPFWKSGSIEQPVVSWIQIRSSSSFWGSYFCAICSKKERCANENRNFESSQSTKTNPNKRHQILLASQRPFCNSIKREKKKGKKTLKMVEKAQKTPEERPERPKQTIGFSDPPCIPLKTKWNRWNLWRRITGVLFNNRAARWHSG